MSARRLAVVGLVSFAAGLGLASEQSRRLPPPAAVQITEVMGEDAIAQLLSGRPMELARVDVEALSAVPGVGPVLARRIVVARDAGRLQTRADLEAIPGVGPSKAASLLRYVDIAP